MNQLYLPIRSAEVPIPPENRGVMYTKRWVVDLLLELAGYSPERNLVDARLVEPAAGNGAFLESAARRLVASCNLQGRPVSDCLQSIEAFEIDHASAVAARQQVVATLRDLSVPMRMAMDLAESWVRIGDYLLEAGARKKANFVVGNPPYIRLEDIPTATASDYRNLYPAMRGRADIYIAFFQGALRQLLDGGVCVFICADRWMLNQYGAELRGLITAQFSVEAIIEMHTANAFAEEVSAYPAITVIRRTEQRRVVVARLSSPATDIDSEALAKALLAGDSKSYDAADLPIESIAAVEQWFEGSEPWPCSSPNRLVLLRRLEANFSSLEDDAATRLGIGVASGRDDVFIVKDNTLVEESRLLPIAMASDTTTGELVWSGNYLVDPWDEGGLVRLEDFPKLRAYLELHKEVLSARHTARKNTSGWYKTIDRVTHSLKSRPKLYIPDIKNEFNPVFDDGNTYPHHNLYYIVSDSWDLEVLGGLLLSSVAKLFIEAYGIRMRGGYLRFQAQYLRRIRVPNPAQINQQQSQALIEAFRTRDRRKASEVALELYSIDSDELELTHGP